jgi:O-Antigen ligase
MVLLVGICLLGGASGTLRYTFPLAALAVGAFLYLLYPGFYVGFVFWLWFLVPLLRRLVDYRGGYVSPNPLLLAPPAVTLITVVTLARCARELTRSPGIFFLMALAAIAYGAGTGLLRVPPQDWFIGIVNWAAPVFFGFHLFIGWRYYPALRANTFRQFLFGSLVMGCYGILQFWILPPWDREWLRQVIADGSGLSFGSAEPTAFRVFSTMNSPGVFAPVLMAGLLLLFTSPGWKRFPVALIAVTAFLLTSVRSAWMGWALGYLVLFFHFTRQQRLRLVWVLLLIGLLAVPLFTIPTFQEIVFGRMQTFGELEQDVSFMSRVKGYQQRLADATTEPFGGGIGSLDAAERVAPNYLLGARDSALIDMLVSLGWFGAALYGAAIILLLFSVVGGAGSDAFAVACSACLVGLVAQFMLGSTMLGATGIVLWGFAGLALAGHKYHAFIHDSSRCAPISMESMKELRQDE